MQSNAFFHRRICLIQYRHRFLVISSAHAHHTISVHWLWIEPTALFTLLIKDNSTKKIINGQSKTSVLRTSRFFYLRFQWCNLKLLDQGNIDHGYDQCVEWESEYSLQNAMYPTTHTCCQYLSKLYKFGKLCTRAIAHGYTWWKKIS